MANGSVVESGGYEWREEIRDVGVVFNEQGIEEEVWGGRREQSSRQAFGVMGPCTSPHTMDTLHAPPLLRRDTQSEPRALPDDGETHASGVATGSRTPVQKFKWEHTT